MAAEANGVGNVEVSPWLKSMPVAPEYHPTLAEFKDPIAYIFKIEKEASKYGICKIVPPVSAAPRKTVVANFNKSLLARSTDPSSGPTFTTRQQQIGFCPRKHRPVQKPVWQSGERYIFAQFEAKAKNFEKTYLKKCSKKCPNALEKETLYWNAMADKPLTVEYANDMPGSAFVAQKTGAKRNESTMTVGETEWNMRGLSRENLSLLRYMKEEIPGVTSPMVYVAMMFSWFAWHVEDHDLHSMNYLHMGAGKTWYGVPREAAVAFEEVIREHGYGGEVNPLVTFAALGEKTTVMSPEVLLSAGVPCCRLVQNAGEFVVTFPRAYHSGFSHGFNCGEAANIATPEWLRVAREAAIRRAAINCPPMVSHFQLLYELAFELYSRVRKNVGAEPRSSRLKDKKKGEGDMLIKELFIRDMVQNNDLLHALGKGSSIALLPKSPPNRSKSRLFPGLYESKHSTRCGVGSKEGAFQREHGLFSCVTCGILCFACVAIVRPTDEAARYLMSGNCAPLCSWEPNAPHTNLLSESEIRKAPTNSALPLNQLRPAGGESPHDSVSKHDEPSSLGLLALAYGDSSDSEGGDGETDIARVEAADPTASTPLNRVDPDGVGIPFASGPDEDSIRLHVFCVEHAVQAEKRLAPVGGAHVFLFCHPDYPELESRAKKAAEESGIECSWNETQFRSANEEDDEIIWLSLENENATHGNGDWAVKLGIDLFYSASLSRCPLYSKQMHYNPVIYDAFGRGSDQVPGRQKKKKIVVAGTWCGRVWMSNQAHPLLVEPERDPRADGPGRKPEDESSLLVSLAVCHNKQVKRKRGSRRPPVAESWSEKDSDDDVDTKRWAPTKKQKRSKKSVADDEEEARGGPKTRLRSRPMARKEGRKKKVVNEEGEYECDVEGCRMRFGTKQELGLHERNVCPVKGCGKSFFSHKYLIQHRRVHMDDRPLKCPWKGCNMTFKWAWARTEHIRVHTGARPYVCTEAGCGQTFRFVSDFSRHKRKTGHNPKRSRR